MKNLSIIENFLFIINSVLAVLFLISLLLPLINPAVFPYLSILSLFSPILIVINFLFVFFWLAKLKKQFLLSTIILCLGYNSALSFINFSNNSLFVGGDNLSVLSYNVRLFNKYNWIKSDDIGNKINSFLISEDPDIICLQEFQDNIINLSNYPYKFKFSLLLKGYKSQNDRIYPLWFSPLHRKLSPINRIHWRICPSLYFTMVYETLKIRT